MGPIPAIDVPELTPNADGSIPEEQFTVVAAIIQRLSKYIQVQYALCGNAPTEM